MVAMDRLKLPPLRVGSSILSRALHEDHSALAQEPESTMVARDRIELPTRGFSVPLTLVSICVYNHLAGIARHTCTTVSDSA